MLETQFVPTTKAAKMLGISEDYLYEIRKGMLKWKKQGNRTFYSKSSVDKLIAKRNKKAN